MKTKRFLGVLLAVCALVCVVGLTTASVSAATEIAMINVTNIPQFQAAGDDVWVGNLAAAGSNGEDPLDEAGEYSECWASETYRWVNADGEEITTYDPANTYLEVVLVPAEGFVLADDVLAVVNWSDRGVSCALTDDGLKITWEYSKDTYANGWITVAEPEVGTEIESEEPFEVSVDTGNPDEVPNYTVTGQWLVYDYESGEYVPFSGTVEAGNVYSLRLTAKPNAGYAFRYVDLMVNNNWVEWQENGDEYFYEVHYSFVDNYIDYVELGALPEAAIGATASEVEIEVYSGNASAVVTWEVLDYTTDEYVPFTGTLEDGKVYRRVLTVRPLEGYVFFEEVSIQFENGGSLWAWTDDPTSVVDAMECSFRPKVDEVIINGVTDAVIGQTATVEGITVPEGVPYSIVDASWWVYTQYEYEEDGVVVDTWYGYERFNGVFEDGKRYRLMFGIELDNTYEFDETPILVNGEQVDWAWSGITYDVELTYSFQEVIDKIELTVSEPEIGNPVYGEVTCGGHYTAEVWWHDDDWSWIDPEEDAVFEDGKRYYQRINLQPEFGYQFAEDAVLYVNGEEFDDWYSVDIDYCDLEIEVSYVDVIETITITGAPEAVAGEKATVESIKVPEDAGYEVNAYWFNETTGEALEEGAVFEMGNKYTLYIEIAVLPGNELDWEATVTVNGEETWFWERGDEYAVLHIEHSLLNPVDSIVISGVKDAVIGEKATVEGIEVPKDAPYELYAYWYCDDEKLEEGTVFEDGKHYYLYIEVVPAKGYEFTDDTTLTVNGEEPEEWFANGEYAWVSMEYSFVEIIDKIEITLTEPVVGETADLSSVKVPEGAPYSIEELILVDAADLENEFSGKYEDGHKYLFGIVISAEDGYEVSRNTVITANGVEVELYQYETKAAMVILEYSFCEIIDKVELTDVPEAVVGETAENVELTVPEDAPYTATGTWYVYDGWYESFEGKFESGKAYRLEVNIVAKEGYELSEETTVITLNGKEYKGNVSSEDYGTTLDLYVTYALDLKVISKVEVTIPELVVGGKLPTLEDLTISEDAGCKLSYLHWACSEVDDIYNYDTARGTVKDGLYYAASLTLRAEDGYVFADDFVLVVNGKTVELSDYGYQELDAVGDVIFMGLICDHEVDKWESNGAGHWHTCSKCDAHLDEGEHVYTDDKDDTCNTCGYKREVGTDLVPDTGDTFASVAALVMMVSLTGALILNKRKFF